MITSSKKLPFMVLNVGTGISKYIEWLLDTLDLPKSLSNKKMWVDVDICVAR